jgi:ribA/ribD-fused uncharacterized protein
MEKKSKLESTADPVIRITKVREENGWLHCMSPHPIEYQSNKFRTAEALFQWMRFKDHPLVQKKILEQKSPMAAKMMARKNRALLNRGEKWDEAPEDIDLMKKCLELKFEQHPELVEKLVDCTTHDRESSRFWGAVLINDVWHGENKLGKLIMELREKLNSSQS